jgi:drug/metabolite transporter (DMT)-like permease
VASLLALASALTYGTADFLGGLATRRSAILPVVVLSQAVGTVVLLAALPFFEAVVGLGDLAWGAAAGIAGAIGLALLYRGLARGPMGVVAPISAVLSASIPVLVGVALGERPRWTALAGVALALPAIVFLSRPAAGDTGGSGVPIGRSVRIAIGSGLAIGAFLVFLGQAGEGAGLWPLLPARVASFGFLGVLALAIRSPLRPTRGSVPLIVGAGLFDMTANILYLLAVQRGLLSLVAVLVSLYPGSTVLLARIVLGDRLRRVQLAGLALAGVSVVLISWR